MMAPAVDRARSASRDTGEGRAADGIFVVNPLALRADDLPILLTRLCRVLAGEQ